MYTQCVLLVALILSAFAPVARPQPGAAPMSGVTIAERLRSEVRSVLANETGDVYSAKRAIENASSGPLAATPALFTSTSMRLARSSTV